MYLLRAIKNIISRLAKLDYDPRNSPPPERTSSLPFSFGGMPIAFAFVNECLWILVGNRSKGLEIIIHLDQNSIFPPIRGWKTFSEDNYTFLSTRIATRSITIAIVLSILTIIYSICSLIISLIDLVFWVMKSSLPVLFLFHFINKIRMDRHEFLKGKSNKEP